MTAVLAFAAAAGLAPSAAAARPESCFAAMPPNPTMPVTCRYTATIRGGVDGVGDWLVHIRRGRKKITIDSRRLPKTCYPEGPRSLCPIGHVLPGDKVTVTARTAPTVVGVGNPCPVANPGVPPPILGGPC